MIDRCDRADRDAQEGENPGGPGGAAERWHGLRPLQTPAGAITTHSFPVRHRIGEKGGGDTAFVLSSSCRCCLGLLPPKTFHLPQYVVLVVRGGGGNQHGMAVTNFSY